MPKATIGEVYKYLAGDGSGGVLNAEQKAAYPLARFRTEWSELDATSKDQISTGIGDGTYTY